MHSEIKANASQYSDFKTHTKSNLLFSMESDFAIEKLSKGYPNCSEDKLRMEYEYFLQSVDTFYHIVPSALSLIAFWICVIFDITHWYTISISLLAYVYGVITLYIPKGFLITMLYNTIGSLYKLTNILWLNKIISIVILVILKEYVLIVAFLLLIVLRFIVHFVLDFISAIVSGITILDATAYNVLGHIIHEHHTIFKWVKLNRKYIDDNLR